MNEYFVPGAVPAPNSPGSSAIIRAEFTSIAAAFDKLPVLAGSAGEFVLVNETGTAMIASGFLFTDFVTLSGTQTLTNKTLAWGDNTWPGFGTGATKTAGTGADNVLLLAEDSKLPALDGNLLTNLNPGELGVVPIANGGTGADTLAGAQAALGINLKADANNAVLTGAPTCPTPPVGNSSARIANTQFVTNTVTAIGAAIPSDATPLMNGVAAPGVHNFVSRDDHVHPTDTSRAPIASPSFTGTLTHSGDVVLSGSVLVNSPAGLGYGPGAGGTVTQATSKSTAVTLNKPSGQITMNAASLASGVTVEFVFNNSLLQPTDQLQVSLALFPGLVGGNYQVWAITASWPGVAYIELLNRSGGALAQAVVIDFKIIKGATS